MKLLFPQRCNGEPAHINLMPGDSMLIVGANGAGKTRFTAEFARSLHGKAFPLSALRAVYTKVDAAVVDAAEVPWLSAPVRADLAGRNVTVLDMLMAQLMHDEMVNLINYKIDMAAHKQASLRKTRLDNVIELWHEVFPGNRLLIDSGRILFARGTDDSAYSAKRLSDGEKAVMYYAAAVTYAPAGSVIFVDSPEIFLHPTLSVALWNRLEALRSDCIFCYTTHDTEFTASRNGARMVWVRESDQNMDAWTYDILSPDSPVSRELYITLAGARKPVLFIEGDSERSIDAKLYPLIFPDFTVRSLGSCNKVIEATRTFNDLYAMHKLDSFGIVDRDRRDKGEVDYLRRKKIMVPDVAEIENMLLIEPVIKTVAKAAGKNPDRVFSKVKHSIIAMFAADIHRQALQHTRHKVKKMVEYRVDARFSDITNMERHLEGLFDEINPRAIYESFCRDFNRYAKSGDYSAVLRVYNQKSMLPGSNVARLCGFATTEDYIAAIVKLLSTPGTEADDVRIAVRTTLGLPSA